MSNVSRPEGALNVSKRGTNVWSNAGKIAGAREVFRARISGGVFLSRFARSHNARKSVGMIRIPVKLYGKLGTLKARTSCLRVFQRSPRSNASLNSRDRRNWPKSKKNNTSRPTTFIPLLDIHELAIGVLFPRTGRKGYGGEISKCGAPSRYNNEVKRTPPATCLKPG